MKIKPGITVSFGNLVTMCVLLTGCATGCPPTCLGERLGAVDWNGRNLSNGKMIDSIARQSNLVGVKFIGADLTGFDLSGADLSGSILTGATLIGANLENTLLSGATFNKTDLTGSSFDKADLTGTELNTSRLTAASFYKTRLVNANLSQLNLAGAYLSESQLAGVNLNRVNLAGGVLDKVDLSGADLRYADLRGAWINLSSLVGANLQNADMSGASLVGSDLTGGNFKGVSLLGANLVGANLRGADLRGADLTAADLFATPELLDREKMPDSVFVDMSSAQWEKLALGDTLLEGAKYDSDTHWPSGFEIPAGLVYMPVIAGQLGDYSSNPAQKLIRISGSQTVLPIAKILGHAFTVNNPQVVFDLSANNSSDGIKQAATSIVDIGMSSRMLSDEEAARYDSLEVIPIALDSILVVVNLENPVENLSSDQIRSIFSGEVTNWSEVGGSDLKIKLLIQKDSISDVFKSKIMGESNVAEEIAEVIPSSAAMRVTIASNPGSIGILPKHLQDNSLKALSIDQVRATSEMITSGQYRLVRPYYLVLRGLPSGEIKGWLDFIFSEEGHQIISLEELEPVWDDR